MAPIWKFSSSPFLPASRRRSAIEVLSSLCRAHQARHSQRSGYLTSLLGIDAAACLGAVASKAPFSTRKGLTIRTRNQAVTLRMAILAVSLGSWLAGPAHGQQPPPDLCGTPFNPAPAISPTIDATLAGPQSDAAFACLMWQSFIELNWPALSAAPGRPDVVSSITPFTRLFGTTFSGRTCRGKRVLTLTA